MSAGGLLKIIEAAPNGPCAITLSLSKNGGADGFIHPITHYSGDIANRITGPGHIVWDIRADYPEENIPNARIRVTATEGLVQHTITCHTVGNGTCTADPATVNHGNTSDIAVTPASGWHIISVVDSVEGVKSGSYTTTVVTSDRTVTATFALNHYDVTCEAVGNGTCTANPASVEHGSTSFITVTPGVGWHIVSVVDSEEGPKPPASYTTTVVTSDRTVTATFVINSYVIGVTSSGNGAVGGGGSYTHGATVTLSATPDLIYHFVNWTEGVVEVSTDPGYSFPATGARTLVGNFAINTYTITTVVVGSGTCVADPGTVNHGNTSDITVAPAVGWYLLSVVDSVEGLKCDSYTTSPVTENPSLHAPYGLR